MGSSQKGGEGFPLVKKCCSYCKATKTPLWRTGPSGPKSLCNACGIRYRKKHPSSKNDVKKSKTGKGQRSVVSKGHWGEVERAALLLMALSCGAVFA